MLADSLSDKLITVTTTVLAEVYNFDVKKSYIVESILVTSEIRLVEWTFGKVWNSFREFAS